MQNICVPRSGMTFLQISCFVMQYNMQPKKFELFQVCVEKRIVFSN